MNSPIAVTNSRWEQFVDNFMVGVEDKVERFETYCQSSDGQNRIAQVQLIATIGAAIILGMISPVTVAVSTLVGIVVRSFSSEQLDRVQEAISRILSTMPFGVKALATVAAMTYTPVVFPVVAGLCLGFEVGARVSPHLLAGGMDKAVSVVED